MKVDRKNLEGKLMSEAPYLLEEPTKLYDYIKDKYDFPLSKAADFLSNRASFSEATDFELFVMLDGFNNTKGSPNRLGSYFTEAEIETYSNTKYKQKRKAKFPLKFKMIQIAPDQWIGATTAKQLMKLRDAQITSYNANIQRTLQRVIRGEKEQWVIKINRSAVNSIRESMDEERFIPNTITLNIPDNLNSDFRYDQDTMTLTINNADHLDIIDGYHRFVAITNETDIRKGFDYPMELRITNFSEDKGQRFIYQEDQKTKMSKKDSGTYNVDDPAVSVARKLNDDSGFDLHGEIKRNKGLINLGEFCDIIRKLYFNNASKKDARIISFEATKQIKAGMNTLTGEDLKYYSKRHNWFQILVELVTIKYFYDNGKDLKNLYSTVEYVLSNKNKIDDRKIKQKAATQNIIKDIVKLIEEV